MCIRDSSYAAKAFSLLLALVLTLSLAVNSAAAVSFQDMNPKDDALLGTKFNVDATITLVTGKDGKDVSLSIPVSGMSKEAPVSYTHLPARGRDLRLRGH